MSRWRPSWCSRRCSPAGSPRTAPPPSTPSPHCGATSRPLQTARRGWLAGGSACSTTQANSQPCGSVRECRSPAARRPRLSLNRPTFVAPVAPDEVAKLVISAARIVQAPRRANPAFVIPALERLILSAGQLRLQLLQGRACLEDQRPHVLPIGRPQRFLEFKCRAGLPLCDPQAQPRIDGKEAPFSQRHLTDRKSVV